MIRNLLFLLLLLHGLDSYCQNFCYEDVNEAINQDYWLLNKQEITYFTLKSSYTIKYSKDSIEIDNKFYTERLASYKDGKKESDFFRKSNGNIYRYDQNTKTESLVFPSNLVTGETWLSADGKWTYTIESLNAAYQTPYCNFKKLLKLRSTNEEESITYVQYFKKGVGLVGVSVNDVSYSFIAPSKEVEKKSYTAIGCEKIQDKNERKYCTNDKITEFIRNNLKNPTPNIHGKVKYIITIDQKGKVSNVRVKESKGVSEEQIKSGIKTLKKLPRFIPAYFNEKPTKVTLTIPITF